MKPYFEEKTNSKGLKFYIVHADCAKCGFPAKGVVSPVKNKNADDNKSLVLANLWIKQLADNDSVLYCEKCSSEMFKEH